MSSQDQIHNIDAVILVGGKNRRFQGKHKSLAKLNGKSILNHQLTVLGSVFQNIILVANKHAEFSNYPINKIVSDIIPGKGPLSGIHAGIQNSRKEYIFIFAGDMPFLDQNLIQKQIQLIETKPAEAIIPTTHAGIEPLHAIYNTRIKDKLEILLNKYDILSVRELLNIIKTYYWTLPYQNAFININTQEELKRYEKI